MSGQSPLRQQRGDNVAGAVPKGAGAAQDGWRTVRLGDVLKLEYGVSLPEHKRLPGRVPVVGSAGVVGSHNQATNEGPGIVIGRKGSIGGVTWMSDDFVPIDTTYYAVPVQGRAHLLWMYHLLAHEDLAKLNRATGVPGLNRDDVYALKRYIPPLPEQRAIAAVLDAIDDAIERAEAVVAATERLRDALLHELLTRGVPGWHTAWRDVPGVGVVPASWEVVRLGEVAEVERGKFAHRPRNEPRFYGGTVPFIQTGDVVRANGRLRQHNQTLNDLGLSISRLFPAGTIIITIAANIGETAIADYPVAFPDSLVGVTPTDIDTTFLECFLRTQKERLNQIAPASAQKNINLEDLRPMAIPLPPPLEQHAIAAILDAADEATTRGREERDSLQSLKASAADALLTGRVRVGSSKRSYTLEG